MQVTNRGEELQSSAQRGEEAAGGKLSLDEHPKPKFQGRFHRRKGSGSPFLTNLRETDYRTPGGEIKTDGESRCTCLGTTRV